MLNDRLPTPLKRKREFVARKKNEPSMLQRQAEPSQAGASSGKMRKLASVKFVYPIALLMAAHSVAFGGGKINADSPGSKARPPLELAVEDSTRVVQNQTFAKSVVLAEPPMRSGAEEKSGLPVQEMGAGQVSLWRLGVSSLVIPATKLSLDAMYRAKFGSGEFGPKLEFRWGSKPQDYALQMDKIGCGMYSYVFSRYGADLFRWVGFSDGWASALGAATSMAGQLYAKLQWEGKYLNGADPMDIVAGAGGNLLGAAKENGWLPGWDLRWAWIVSRTAWRVVPKHIVLDEYGNQAMAVTAQVGQWLSDSKWIKPLAVGVSVQINERGDGLRYRAMIYYRLEDIAPDWMKKPLEFLILPVHITFEISQKGQPKIGNVFVN